LEGVPSTPRASSPGKEGKKGGGEGQEVHSRGFLFCGEGRHKRMWVEGCHEGKEERHRSPGLLPVLVVLLRV